MKVTIIGGATRTLGASQGYIGLPIRDELQLCSVNGETPAMVSEWVPSPQERQAISNGANLFLHVIGAGHPPVRIEVEDGA